MWGGLCGVSLVGFMVTDHATGGGTQLTVANDCTGNPASDCTLDAALGISG